MPRKSFFYQFLPEYTKRKPKVSSFHQLKWSYIIKKVAHIMLAAVLYNIIVYRHSILVNELVRDMSGLGWVLI